MAAAGIRELLARRWFRWLFGTRLVSQCGDGVVHSRLPSAGFFNPDHQTDPKQAAAGFVVLLLPYSLVGPFAGVFLDRWRRQRVLVRANLVRVVFIIATAGFLLADGPRGVRFYVCALAALSVNRFYLAALSASLPHVVRRQQLLLANATTTTAGTVIAIVGLGVGLVVRRLAGSGDHGSAVIAVTSCAVYLTAAAVASRMPVDLLGPDEQPGRLHAALRAVVGGLVAGAQHVWQRRPAARALLAISGARVLFGLSTIGSLLLYRNYFHDQGVLRADLVGLSQAFAASAVGFVAAAFVTPTATARTGKPRWVVIVVGGAAVVHLVFRPPFPMAPLLVGACLLGFATQSAKICVDTIVQEEVADEFRGRVFSFYDTLFNLTFLAAAVLAAFVLPPTGKSYPVTIALAVGYALIAAAYARSERPRRGITAAARGSEAVM